MFCCVHSETEGDKMESSPLRMKFSNKMDYYLQGCANVALPQKTSLKELLDSSRNFPIKFPVTEMTCHSLLRNRKDVSPTKLEQYINSAYPVIHEAVFHLFTNFLDYKKEHGTKQEMQLYADMGVTDLAHRLLVKRAVAFYGDSDRYLLISGESGYGGWEEIGKRHENPPLTLENCLSYDEIKLSALLSVSSHNLFINDGSRGNKGIPASDPDLYQADGVIVGVIGARFENPGFMDWEEIIISKEQNIASNGYGSAVDNSEKEQIWRKIWADFYGIHLNLPVYSEAIGSKDQYSSLSDDLLFNDVVYKRRVAVTAETLLLDSEARACRCGAEAYVKVVGFGLGVWKVSSRQECLFLEAFAECIRRLFPVLGHVSDIHFLWFNKDKCGGAKNGDMICKREDGSGIRVHFSRGTPHSRLDGNKLLVASYAWDGNALPGNEFWEGCLCASGDPAEACSSQIAELHNPHVNSNCVSGSNLHIASPQWGVLHVAEYARRLISKMGN